MTALLAVVAYIRVSSRGQDHALQRSAVERAAAARGDTVATWYAEKRTATTNERPELARLLAEARAGRVGRLYVFRLDRLTRTGIADTLALVKELRELGVEVVNLADGFAVPLPNASGTAASIGQLILAVLAWAAEMELHTRRERIAARRELADERGEAWGRPSRIDPATRRAILDKWALGDSVRTIAQAVKVPRSTVGRVVAPGGRAQTADPEGAELARRASAARRERAQSTCPACEGRGWCPLVAGPGRVPTGERVTCGACGGRGLSQNPPPAGTLLAALVSRREPPSSR